MLNRIRHLMVRLYEAWHARAGIHGFVPLCVAGSVVMLLLIDPFGIEEASHARSEQATLRITSPWYKPSGKVTAVVIDDEYIGKRAAGWPLTYGDQGRLMRSILASDPAVLVVDLVYPHRHTGPMSDPPVDSVTDIVEAITRSATSTPVVFTAMALDPGLIDPKFPDFRFCPEKAETTPLSVLDKSSIQEELLKRFDDPSINPGKSHLRLAYVRWSGCGNRYPLLLGGLQKAATPAFEAFRAYCEWQQADRKKNETSDKTKKKEEFDPCKARPPTENPGSYFQPMIVRSGAFPPSTQAFAYGSNTCQEFAERKDVEDFVPWWRRLEVSLTQASLGLFEDLRNNPHPAYSLPCPAVTVVPLSVLESASVDELASLFTGKAVLIGANLSGIPDAVASQVHGQIPGVVWHAMALDNLLSLGSGYLTNRYEKQQPYAQAALIVIFAYVFPFIMGWLERRTWKKILATVSLIVWCALAAVQHMADNDHTALLSLGIGVALDLTKPTVSAGYLAAVVIAALCSVLFLERGWPPGNWFGLVIVVIGFAHTIKPYFHGEERKHIPHPASLLGPPLMFLIHFLSRPVLRGEGK